MKLTQRNENKMSKNEKGNGMPPFEITTVVLDYFNIDNNYYQPNRIYLSCIYVSCMYLVLINLFVSY